MQCSPSESRVRRRPTGKLPRWLMRTIIGRLTFLVGVGFSICCVPATPVPSRAPELPPLAGPFVSVLAQSQWMAGSFRDEFDGSITWGASQSGQDMELSVSISCSSGVLGVSLIPGPAADWRVSRTDASISDSTTVSRDRRSSRTKTNPTSTARFVWAEALHRVLDRPEQLPLTECRINLGRRRRRAEAAAVVQLDREQTAPRCAPLLARAPRDRGGARFAAVALADADPRARQPPDDMHAGQAVVPPELATVIEELRHQLANAVDGIQTHR